MWNKINIPLFLIFHDIIISFTNYLSEYSLLDWFPSEALSAKSNGSQKFLNSMLKNILIKLNWVGKSDITDQHCLRYMWRLFEQKAVTVGGGIDLRLLDGLMSMVKKASGR